MALVGKQAFAFGGIEPVGWIGIEPKCLLRQQADSHRDQRFCDVVPVRHLTSRPASDQENASVCFVTIESIGKCRSGIPNVQGFDAGLQRNFKKQCGRLAPGDMRHISEPNDHPVQIRFLKHGFAFKFVLGIRIDGHDGIAEPAGRLQVSRFPENMKSRRIDDAGTPISYTGRFDNVGCAGNVDLSGQSRIGIAVGRENRRQVYDDILIFDRGSNGGEVPHVAPFRVDGAPSIRSGTAAASVGKVEGTDAMAAPEKLIDEARADIAEGSGDQDVHDTAGPDGIIAMNANSKDIVRMTPRCSLPPFPTGWVCLGRSEEFPKGAVAIRRVAGEDRIVFRTDSGQVGVVESACPHLGAHLGHGGTVVGESLRCPFHGFCYDRQGTCTHAYNAEPPASARLRAWPVCEVSGFVMTWYDAAGRAPLWSLPDDDFSSWAPLRFTSWTVRCHPQELVENTADIGHLTALHGYRVANLEELKTDGHLLTARIAAHRDLGVFGTRGGSGIRARFEIRLNGLGFSTVDVVAEELGVLCRQFLLVTPEDENRVRLRIAMRVKQTGKGSVFVRLTPRPIFNTILSRFMFREFARDVSQDFDVWNNKKYLDRPALARGDGPFGAYRKWARQFYPELAPVAGS